MSDVPMKCVNKGVFLESLGLLFVNTSISLKDELEVRRRALDKMDGYFYGRMSSLLRSNDRPYIPFK
jgi:hypothetical protein